tara:strand:+ start:746 stop:892 length:147 start_codon:yes stop_codon:yes gene_type:complete
MIMFKEKEHINIETYLCERMIYLMDHGLIEESVALKEEFHLDDSDLFE